ncbi:MAG: hypothetical protein HKP13_07825, partial [Gammaproteobacteria bacterium]|nr:hypothetical protein [Gammaproteobacteria bacterium]
RKEDGRIDGTARGIPTARGIRRKAPIPPYPSALRSRPEDIAPLLADCDHVTERAMQWLEWRTPSDSVLDIALENLTLARAALYRAVLSADYPNDAAPTEPLSALTAKISEAVDGLREAGRADHLPHGLLTRAWYRALTDDMPGARFDLDEAWGIAERGPMPLFQADILLTRARLFFSADREQAKRDLDAARCLIMEKHHYHRRDGELDDAGAIIHE